MLTFPTLIHGVSGINVVPALCEAYGDARLLPGLSAERVRELIKKNYPISLSMSFVSPLTRDKELCDIKDHKRPGVEAASY